MAWIEARNFFPQARKPIMQRLYTVQDCARIMAVSKQTVYKWLCFDDPENAVISPDDWIKLPNSGHIRIKEKAIHKLQQNK